MLFAVATLLCALQLLGAERAAAVGELGWGQCFDDTTSEGCIDASATGSLLAAPRQGAVSPNGANVYVADEGGNLVSIFDRAPGGGLSFAGCVGSDGTGGCIDLPGAPLQLARAVAVSPDGANLYVGSLDTVTVFNILAGGALEYAGCVSNDGSGGLCVDPPGSPFNREASVAVSPDGDDVYAVGVQSETIAAFHRVAGGSLLYAGCFSNRNTGGLCGSPPPSTTGLLVQPESLAISPDGTSAYVATFLGIAVLSRVQGGGLIWSGCISNDGSSGLCAAMAGVGPSVRRMGGLAVASDGGTLYGAATESGAVVFFKRGATGDVSFSGCLSDSGSGGLCAPLGAMRPLMPNPSGVAVSPDGKSVYVSVKGDIVDGFSRLADGKLVFQSCVSNDGSEGHCVDLPGTGTPMHTPDWITVSPDGASVYTTGGALVGLTRKPFPQTTIGSGPVDGTTIGQPRPVFTFSSDRSGATFECAVDTATFSPCASPLTIGPLANGPHRFAVRAVVGGDADPTPASRSFAVFVPIGGGSGSGGRPHVPPTVKLTKFPKRRVRTSKAKAKAVFRFAADQPGATFVCKLDRKPAAPCRSPKIYSLRPGKHRFTVKALGPDGAAGPPVSFAFAVRRR